MTLLNNGIARNRSEYSTDTARNKLLHRIDGWEEASAELMGRSPADFGFVSRKSMVALLKDVRKRGSNYTRRKKIDVRDRRAIKRKAVDNFGIVALQ
ncbi:MAG: hypothetical protein VB034_07535 [Eubacteriales bacterium]|nr:hypothetical protein [Eubacteriales bacterium]